jgi:hypothetical protein
MSKPLQLILTTPALVYHPSTRLNAPIYGILHQINGNNHYTLAMGPVGNTNCCGAVSLTGILLKEVTTILSLAKMGKSIILFLGPGYPTFSTENLFPILVQEANKKMEGILEIVYEQLDAQEHLMMFYPKDVQEFKRWVNT